ncbi:MAG: SDR family oxidoreductase [Woeseia sp.]|nr:SDR family oxidoreductase [Woeseia sp.]NNL55112.1 SDR family oxidoreductase [Woeseia sp.]
MLDMTGKSALVTGASQHIGAAIALRLAEAGARVLVHYRSKADDAARVVDAIRDAGGEARAVGGELSDPRDVAAVVQETIDAFGGIDVLVNNAGSFPVGAFLDLSHEDWRAMQRSNVESAFLCTQEAARYMKEHGGGAIVNIASIAASSPGPDHSHYNSAKAALVMLTRSAAQELGNFAIRVNSVSPGVINRAGIRENWPEGVQRWETRAPLQRMGEPEDVADACLFLLSDASRWISGHDLVVDGGMMAASVY